MIDPFSLVSLEGVVWVPRAKTPYLDCPVETRRGKCVCIFRINSESHDIVAVPLVYLHTFPPFIPIPKFYAHVIGGREDEGLRRVDNDSANVVGMRFEGCDFFGGIVVVDSNLKVVGATYYPVLARNETSGSDRNVCKLESLYYRLSSR